MFEVIGRTLGLLPQPSKTFQFSPTKGYELTPGQGEVNSLGLRDREYQLVSRAATFRIVAIGDSYTFGSGVKLLESYPKRLETMLNERLGGTGTHFEVLNAGVPGYNTYQELIHLQEAGLKFSPNLILLGFTLGDAELGDLGLKDVRNRGWLIRFKQSIKDHLSLYPSLRLRLKPFVEWFDPSAQKEHLPDASMIPLHRATEGESSEGWTICRQSLKDLAAVARARTVPVLVVIFPSLVSLGEEYPFKAEHELVARTAMEDRMAHLDLFSAFRGNDPAGLRVSATNGHPNARGHLIAAEAIYQALVANALLPDDDLTRLRDVSLTRECSREIMGYLLLRDGRLECWSVAF